MKKVCIIGWPIGHSRSPLIHNYWIKKHNLQASYEKLAIHPDHVAEFISTISSSEFIGCNVTIPHKEAAFTAAAIIDEPAQRLKAVNTIYVRDQKVHGTNTDGEGFLQSLKDAHPGFKAEGSNIILIGAGGAAKAIASALLDQGAKKIGVMNRTADRIKNLQRQFGPAIYEVSNTNLGDALKQCGLLVNTTSLGMQNQPALELDISSLNPKAIVADIVYTPLVTAFLKRANEKGNPTLGGLGMLLHQAVKGFELWFGIRPSVTPELYDLVAADVLKAGQK